MTDFSLPDPETIPLPEDIPIPFDAPPAPDEIPPPEDIPVPDEIPLPPEEEYPMTSNKRALPDDDDTVTNQHLRDQSLHVNNVSKKVKLSTTANKRRATSRRKHTSEEPIIPDRLRQEQEMMAKLMGFSNFDTTKGKMVPGNQSIGAVHVVKKRRYRQYMNRKGGFNRPLDKVP